ncbi:MAG TPA: hypothetical protein VGH08_05730 [Chthoniobacterales bacterium]
MRIAALVAASVCFFSVALVRGASLAGHAVKEGGTLDFTFPVPKYFQDYAAQGGNPRPPLGRLLLMFPPGFDPMRACPILIVTSTTDAHRTSPMDAPWYRDTAMAEGWIVLASDATIPPRNDSTVWRLALLGAALDLLHREWPQSVKWPVAFAGLSGGAKRSGWIGAMLSASNTVKICGFFLAGINDDRLSAACKAYRPSANFLKTPIWISSGQNDFIARPRDQEMVKNSLEHTGFKQVHLSHFLGGHELDKADLRQALKWFRKLGGF